ncbi:MAG: Bicoid-interacting protein 3-domain-containing protein [Benjaminiella poitrasii]|nr:MAG: Bicoid-interacting protein 3-domain-containing protein [Benjaminiella poitrasii]
MKRQGSYQNNHEETQLKRHKADINHEETGSVLGAKSKGAHRFAGLHKKDDKKPFGKFIYGNFPDYYTKRRKQNETLIDPRIDLLERSLFENKHILDIGCNTGNICIALAKKYSVASIHGVDIDERLISKAQTNLRVVYSLENPHKSDDDNAIDLSFRFHYFPQSMTNMFGLMPMALPPGHPSQTSYPHNVHFEALDWLETKETDTVNHYDTILALSITKWIQLHHGDKGLESFFKKVYDSLAPGGTFVLEPQDFDTFQKRAKEIDPSKDIQEELKFRPEHYTDFLINKLGFKEHLDLGIPKGEIKGFSRPILIYKK